MSKKQNGTPDTGFLIKNKGEKHKKVYTEVSDSGEEARHHRFSKKQRLAKLEEQELITNDLIDDEEYSKYRRYVK